MSSVDKSNLSEYLPNFLIQSCLHIGTGRVCLYFDVGGLEITLMNRLGNDESKDLNWKVSETYPESESQHNDEIGNDYYNVPCF